MLRKIQIILAFASLAILIVAVVSTVATGNLAGLRAAAMSGLTFSLLSHHIARK